MTESVEQLLGRIEQFTPQPTPPLSDSVTGSLADLVTWWQQRTPGELDITAIDTGGTSGLAQGADRANQAIDSGSTLLILTSSLKKESPLARAIIGLLSRKDAFAVSFHAPGVTDREAMESMAAVRDLMRQHSELRGAPIELAQLDPEVDFTVGLLLTASARRTPVITGTVTHLAAALIGNRLSIASSNWWRHGATSPDPGVFIAVDRIGMSPGIPLSLSDIEGIGARISAQLLASIAT